MNKKIFTLGAAAMVAAAALAPTAASAKSWHGKHHHGHHGWHGKGIGLGFSFGFPIYSGARVCRDVPVKVHTAYGVKRIWKTRCFYDDRVW